MLKRAIKTALSPVKRWLQGETNALLAQNRQLIAQNHLLTGRMACLEVRSRNSLTSLADAEFKVSSQWGEDGIIDWLIERADVPPASRSFIEFGVETYRESNTRFLLQNRNWRGLIMDGSSAMVDAVREDGLAWTHDLTAQPAFITRDNIDDLIRSAGFAGEVGLLSIDIDGNDYWVWEAIRVVEPIIVVCEYNAVFGDVHAISIPYEADFNRVQAHFSYLYAGASIAALRQLAARKGYSFAGTNSAGSNAFFVREDYARRFVESSLKNIRALPSLIRESRDESGRMDYIAGTRRLERISALPVVNVLTGETHRLGDLEGMYSREWLELMKGRGEGGVAGP